MTGPTWSPSWGSRWGGVAGAALLVALGGCSDGEASPRPTEPPADLLAALSDETGLGAVAAPGDILPDVAEADAVQAADRHVGYGTTVPTDAERAAYLVAVDEEGRIAWLVHYTGFAATQGEPPIRQDGEPAGAGVAREAFVLVDATSGDVVVAHWTG